MKIEYVSKEDEGNAILAEVVAFKEYLGEEFIGMPYDDIREMAAEDKLIHYIKERYEPSKEFENLRSSNASAGVMIKCNQKSQEFLDSYYYIHYHFNDQYSNEDKVRKITTSNDLLCD